MKLVGDQVPPQYLRRREPARKPDSRDMDPVSSRDWLVCGSVAFEAWLFTIARMTTSDHHRHLLSPARTESTSGTVVERYNDIEARLESLDVLDLFDSLQPIVRH